MNPIFPILAIGALIGLAMSARSKRPQMHALPPPAPHMPAQPHPAVAASHAATLPMARAVPHGHATKAPRVPAPTQVIPAPPAPPQSLPDLAKQAHTIFTTPAPPAVGPTLAPYPTPRTERNAVPVKAAAAVPALITDVTPPPPPAAVPAPIAAPAPALLPTGFDADKARRTAPRIATHLKSKGVANYSRQALREFQTLAGLKPDGIYGGATAGALRYYLGGAAPPKPMFAPLEEVPYTQPGG